MGRVIGFVDNENFTKLSPDLARSRLEAGKGQTITFFSALAEAEAIRDSREARRCTIVQRLCAAKADMNAGVFASGPEHPLVVAARAGQASVAGFLAQHCTES